MKILIASDLYAPVHNGVAKFSENLAIGLAKRGHDVAVIAPSQTGKKSVEHENGVTIYRTKSTIFPFYQNFRISVTPQLEVRRILQEFQPDIIHIQMLLGVGTATMFFGRRYDIPVVTTSHAMAENLLDNLKKMAVFSRPINYMLSEYGLRFHSQADVITSPTKSGLEVFGGRAERIERPVEIISNGVDLSLYTPQQRDAEILKKFDLPEDRPIVTYIGRVDAEKHLSVLVRAMHRIVQEKSAHLLIVGYGVDMDCLKELAEELDIEDHVTFTGRVSEEDKLALEQVGSLYAIPSPAELQSIATLEAMACGQPVVAVDAGALPELCQDGRNGYLFPLDDDEKMAEAIAKILSDKELRAQFSEQSLAIAKTHDLQHTLDQFLALYDRTTEAKQAEIASRPSGWRDRILDAQFFDYMRSVRGSTDDELDQISDDEIKKL